MLCPVVTWEKAGCTSLSIAPGPQKHVGLNTGNFFLLSKNQLWMPWLLSRTANSSPVEEYPCFHSHAPETKWLREAKLGRVSPSLKTLPTTHSIKYKLLGKASPCGEGIKRWSPPYFPKSNPLITVGYFIIWSTTKIVKLRYLIEDKIYSVKERLKYGKHLSFKIVEIWYWKQNLGVAIFFPSQGRDTICFRGKRFCCVGSHHDDSLSVCFENVPKPDKWELVRERGKETDRERNWSV